MFISEWYFTHSEIKKWCSYESRETIFARRFEQYLRHTLLIWFTFDLIVWVECLLKWCFDHEGWKKKHNILKISLNITLGFSDDLRYEFTVKSVRLHIKINDYIVFGWGTIFFIFHDLIETLSRVDHPCDILQIDVHSNSVNFLLDIDMIRSTWNAFFFPQKNALNIDIASRNKLINYILHDINIDIEKKTVYENDNHEWDK